MKDIIIDLLIIFLFLAFTSCKTKTIYVPVKQSSLEIVTLRDTTVKHWIEVYRDSVSTPDSVSYLSNKYAFSYAELKKGSLNHSLSTWPDSSITLNIKYVDRYKVDSIPAPYPVEIIKEVEKELTAWQKIRMRAGEVGFIIILIISISVFIKKKF